MTQKLTPHREFEPIYEEIRTILDEARSKAWRAVNTTMVVAYWNVGRVIVENEQKGQSRAEYGKQLIEALSKRLTVALGKGFDRSNIWNMKGFYLNYPKLEALRRELSWTHYRLLLRVDKPEARQFYENEAINAHWSTRELDRQICSLLFERLTLSKDKETVMQFAQKGHEILKPSDLVKDPMVLEFVGIPQASHYLESTLEQGLIDKLQQFLLELGKGFAFMGRQLKKKPWFATLYPKDNNKFLPPSTNFICLPKKS